MMSLCKLCLNEKDLIKRAHLFPNFMYKGIGDDKMRMNVINTLNPLNSKVVQSGAYEQGILCQECDNDKLSVLERYANNYLYSQPYRNNTDNFNQVTNDHGVNFVTCRNIDYSQFKLFLQSLIWRASVSSHKLFANFKLSKQQEEQLRISILNSIPLDEDEFACAILTYADSESVEADLVYVHSNEKERKAIFVINQFMYLFHFEKAGYDLEFNEVILKRNNEMSIVKLPFGGWAQLRDYVFNSLAEIAKRNL